MNAHTKPLPPSQATITVLYGSNEERQTAVSLLPDEEAFSYLSAKQLAKLHGLCVSREQSLQEACTGLGPKNAEHYLQDDVQSNMKNTISVPFEEGALKYSLIISLALAKMSADQAEDILRDKTNLADPTQICFTIVDNGTNEDHHYTVSPGGDQADGYADSEDLQEGIKDVAGNCQTCGFKDGGGFKVCDAFLSRLSERLQSMTDKGIARPLSWDSHQSKWAMLLANASRDPSTAAYSIPDKTDTSVAALYKAPLPKAPGLSLALQSVRSVQAAVVSQTEATLGDEDTQKKAKQYWDENVFGKI